MLTLSVDTRMLGGNGLREIRVYMYVTVVTSHQSFHVMYKKLSAEKWERVVTTFVKLFKTTTPHQLFDENLRTDVDGSA